jgi:hypothetical protein
MPLYTFEDTNTGEIHEFMLTYDQKLELLKDFPHFTSIISRVNYTGDGGLKHSTEMREVFQKIKKAHPLSTVDTGNKTEV